MLDTTPRTFAVANATHRYATLALDGVGLELTAGRIHALMGANGSGKSTLVKVLTGALIPDAAEIAVDGKPVHIGSPRDAQRLGVAVVHQDYQLYPDLTVAENIYASAIDLPRRSRSRVHDRRAIRRAVEETLSSLDLDVDPDASARSLDTAGRKLTEIARAMIEKPRFLFLDEPTASMEVDAADTVLALIERLADNGVGVCFVSHRLDEVERVATDATVLRDGRLVARLAGDEIDAQSIARHMFGETESASSPVTARRLPPVPSSDRERMLAIEGVPTNGRERVRVELHRGEILGLTGAIGSGVHEIVQMVAGVGGDEVRLSQNGSSRPFRSIRDARDAGIGYVPEDRKRAGLALEQTIVANLSLASIGVTSSKGLLRRGATIERTAEFMERLSIKASSPLASVGSLSGGNQQKVLLGRWLAASASVLAIEEPTHGVDLFGKQQIYELLRDFAAEGGSVLIASTDLEDVIEVCDRVAVVRHGRLGDPQDVAGLTRTDILVAGSGANVLEEVGAR